MRLIDLNKVSNYKVEKWLLENIPKLTDYQKSQIRNSDSDSEIIRFAPFYFMERNKKVDKIWLRFTIIFILPVLFLLILGLPFNFFITGRW
jgi:hypothetical protein